MKIEFKPEMTFETMCDTLNAELPQYKTSIKKNPILGFQYLEIRKSGTVGVWVRVMDKKGTVQLMNAFPSFFVRLLLGGLLLLLFVTGAQTQVRKEVGAVLINKFSSKEL